MAIDLLAVRTDGSLQSSPDSSDYHASDESEHSPHPSPPLRSQRSMDNSFSASVEQQVFDDKVFKHSGCNSYDVNNYSMCSQTFHFHQKSRRARAPSEPSTDSDSDQTADTPPKRVKLNHTTIVASDSDNGPSRNMPAPFPYLVSDSDRQHVSLIIMYTGPLVLLF